MVGYRVIVISVGGFAPFSYDPTVASCRRGFYRQGLTQSNKKDSCDGDRFNERRRQLR